MKIVTTRVQYMHIKKIKETLVTEGTRANYTNNTYIAAFIKMYVQSRQI